MMLWMYGNWFNALQGLYFKFGFDVYVSDSDLDFNPKLVFLHSFLGLFFYFFNALDEWSCLILLI